MDRKGEQKRAKRVPLLDAGLRREDMVVENQVCVVAVAPLGPASKFRKMLSDLAEGGGSVQRVESVPKIDLKEDLICGGVARAPLAKSVDGDLRPQGGAAAHLERPQHGAGGVLSGVAEALRGEPAEDFAYCDRPYTPVFLRNKALRWHT